MAAMINGFFPGELQPSTIIAGCINVYENAWPTPQKTIADIEDECANPESAVAWFKAETIGAGTFQSARTNLNMGITDLALQQNNQLMQNVHNQFNMMLLASTQSYAQRYDIHDPLMHEPYNILKYSGGQEYKAHYDGGSTTSRAISAIVYLNNDYNGGELEFPNFGIKIKPEPGMLVLFPSNFAYSHIAHPVTDGTKYALVTWIRDRV
jgi:predicted 2-oxoglutarate/Fe(II)-dependent dioxygenase YbiX|tara:strand:- start:1302 stop:1928 length:627 start_codon:yes stop_codon:yes gene_type:complete